MRKIIVGIVKILTRIVYRIKIEGKENIPINSAGIICANHVHFLDSAVVISNIKQKINILAKEDLFKNKFIKWLAKNVGVYPIKRNSADMHAIKTSLKLLKNNELLMIFPEGTRKGMEKKIKPKNGAVMIAIKSGTPIIPMGIKGNFKPFRKILIRIEKPIDYSEYKEKTNDKVLIDKLTMDLMQKIIKLTQ